MCINWHIWSLYVHVVSVIRILFSWNFIYANLTDIFTNYFRWINKQGKKYKYVILFNRPCFIHSIFFFNLKQYEIKFENALYENSRWLNRPFSIYIFFMIRTWFSLCMWLMHFCPRAFRQGEYWQNECYAVMGNVWQC